MGFKMALYERESNDRAMYLFENTDVANLSASVKLLFDRLGYKLEEGTQESGVYGTGNGIMRFLFGVFAKRYRFRISVVADQQKIRLRISKAMSGASGGVMGYKKMNSEFERIIQELKRLS